MAGPGPFIRGAEPPAATDTEAGPDDGLFVTPYTAGAEARGVSEGTNSDRAIT